MVFCYILDKNEGFMTDNEFVKNRETVQVAPYALYDALHALHNDGCKCVVSKEDDHLVIHYAKHKPVSAVKGELGQNDHIPGAIECRPSELPLETNSRTTPDFDVEKRCWVCGKWKPASEFTDEVYLSLPPKYRCYECAGKPKTALLDDSQPHCTGNLAVSASNSKISICKEKLCSSIADMEKIRPIADKPHSLSDTDLDSGMLPPKVPKDLKI
jgi:hypothetical protein